MRDAEFDAHSVDYSEQHRASVAFSGLDLDYFATYKADIVRVMCDRNNVSPLTIMDFGAGIGNAVRPLRAQFPGAAIQCVDVSAESLEHCAALEVPNSTTHVYDGQTLPFSDGSVDVVFTACVFHHIEHDNHIHLLSEIRRCLRPDGLFILFEHNPFNPLTQIAVARCAFDEHAVLIHAGLMRRRFTAAGFNKVNIGFRIFFPGFLRALRWLEPYLERLPFGGQYYVVARS